MAYKNKEDQKAASRRHYLKHKEEIKEKSRLRKLENPEREKEYQKKYYNKPSEIEGVSVGVLQRRKYVEENRDKYLETNQNWRDNKKEHISNYNHKYWEANKEKLKEYNKEYYKNKNKNK
tara:strand:- start:59 stop:418 length:360 start_codon:yes stop_codon:yes gene_type:complete